jgi:DNA-binding NtrC family response regulator
MFKALIVDDDTALRDALKSRVEDAGFQVRTAETVSGAKEVLETDEFDLLLLDVHLADGSGIEILDSLDDDAEAEIVMLADSASVDSAVAALRGGAIDYLGKPPDDRRLRKILKAVKRAASYRARIAALDRELRGLGRFEGMIGSSPEMQKVYSLIEKVAPTTATVLISGETGTGKEVAAQVIHRRSRRADGPFVAINCGAVPANLMESELFGHEKGSFTGADRLRQGVFERADRGTILLDEVTEMPAELQVKLLRVLETGKLRRVGGDREISFDTRILAATNREPAEAVREGKLREDLLFRLSVFPIAIPPLRQREGDVPQLAEFFLSKLNEASEGPFKRFHEAALRRLAAHDWPGNVRELANTIERGYILAEEEIREETLPIGSDLAGIAAATRREEAETVPRRDSDAAHDGSAALEGLSLAEVERRHILATVERMKGDKKEAAKILGISLKTLYNRLKKYREA